MVFVPTTESDTTKVTSDCLDTSTMETYFCSGYIDPVSHSLPSMFSPQGFQEPTPSYSPLVCCSPHPGPSTIPTIHLPFLKYGAPQDSDFSFCLVTQHILLGQLPSPMASITIYKNQHAQMNPSSAIFSTKKADVI